MQHRALYHPDFLADLARVISASACLGAGAA